MKHVHCKCIHITDALNMFVLYTVKEEAITWIECCQLAIDKNYGIIKFVRTVASWYLQLHEYDLRFKRSQRGKYDRLARSPFAEDELLAMRFKS